MSIESDISSIKSDIVSLKEAFRLYLIDQLIISTSVGLQCSHCSIWPTEKELEWYGKTGLWHKTDCPLYHLG